MSSKEMFLEDEVFIIEDAGGEMPEVAMHGSLYFLCSDPEGPGLSLEKQDHLPLKKAVINRYQTIILRDLQPENRKKSIYRGLQRSAINWRRLKLFAEAQNLDTGHVRQKVAAALVSFLEQEICFVRLGERSCINCSRQTLCEFAGELGLCSEDLAAGWQDLCCGQE
ncbi:MAG: hypothetical protein M0P70_01935 [Desulfobulbaceae bacterium]|nr:hypothetical protein [Desulfobulbaceae bacterium]